MDVGWLPIVWFGLAAVVVVSSLGASRSRRAYRVAVGTVGVLWIVAGAGANLYFLARGDDFSGFADGSWSTPVRETWESLVVPNHTLFIGLLIAFQATAGVLVLIGSRARQLGLILLIGFNLALIAFGWSYVAWSIPLSLALYLLWRAGVSVRDRVASA